MQIEEPFAILPLDQHQVWLQRDADEMKRVLRYHQLVDDGVEMEGATDDGRGPGS